MLLLTRQFHSDPKSAARSSLCFLAPVNCNVMLEMRYHIDNLRKEAETTLRVLYALMQFRHSITCKECVDQINKNADFWLIYESSIRTNLFIGIRRLYENKADTFNFQKFIERCENNIEEFSKKSIRKRKINGNDNAHEWIDEYMESVYEATLEDFRSLSRFVRDNSKKMKGMYTNVASTIFAHAVHIDRPEIYDMMKDLELEEIETALNSIWHAYEQIWQMYENGRKPSIQIRPYPYKQEVVNSVANQVGCKC